MVVEWIVVLSCCDKIVGNEFGILVDKLVKSVLVVGVWFVLDNRFCFVVNYIVIVVNVFVVIFYIVLLEIGRKVMEVLVVREDGFCFCIKEIVVLNVD